MVIPLHRDGAQAVPQLGVPAVVEESTGPAGSRTRFVVAVQVDDRLGQRATSAPCFEYGAFRVGFSGRSRSDRG
ncbi:MAG: hypothetical protein R3B06_12455 [Kofleriaceae bacterium]